MRHIQDPSTTRRLSWALISKGLPARCGKIYGTGGQWMCAGKEHQLSGLPGLQRSRGSVKCLVGASRGAYAFGIGLRGTSSVPNTAPIVEQDLRCTQCPVYHHSVCQALGGIYLDDLAEIMTPRHFDAGTEIVHQGDTSNLFGIITSGIVKLTRMLPDGRQHIVCLLSEADCIGDVFSALSHDSAMCVTDVELCCFQREQFDEIIKTHPNLGHHLLHRVTQDLEEAREWLTALGRKNSIERVAMFLLWSWNEEHNHCAYLSKPASNRILHVPLSREEIADFLGLTFETVSRNISKLDADGVIELINAKCIEIRNLDNLRRIAASKV